MVHMCTQLIKTAYLTYLSNILKPNDGSKSRCKSQLPALHRSTLKVIVEIIPTMSSVASP